MDLRADIKGIAWRPFLLVYESFRGRETLVDGDVSTLSCFNPPFIGKGITTEGKLHTVPLERITHASVDSVDSRKRTNSYAVLLVDHLIDLLIVKLRNFELEAKRIHIALS